jgi:uncharacterized protein with HEPN domain
MRDDRLRYRDVLMAIEQIRLESIGTLEEFLGDRKQQVWVLFHLQIIGEALASVSPDQHAAYESAGQFHVITPCRRSQVTSRKPKAVLT